MHKAAFLFKNARLAAAHPFWRGFALITH